MPTDPVAPPEPEPSLLVLPDAAPGVGFGHLSRGVAVVEEWTRRGGTATIGAVVEHPLWIERCERAGARLERPDAVDPTAFSWTVLDGYELDPGLQALARTCARLAAIVDHGRGSWAEPVDLVVDPNLGARASSAAPTLAGGRFALLRRDVLAAAAAPGPFPTVVVVGGGAPPAPVLAWMEAVAAELASHDVDVSVLRGDRDFASVAAGADVVVTASGTALLEALALGRPVVAFTWADNQRPGAAHVRSLGIDVVGDVVSTAPAAVGDIVARLVADDARRAQLSERAGALVDGRGARRVVSRMIAGLLDVRPSSTDDASLLWGWANDPAVRAYAFSQSPIPWEDHLRWIARKTADPRVDIVVVSLAGQPIGQVRFEQDGARAEVDVSVDADVRGRGLGGPVLIAAADWYLQRYPVVGSVEAAVRVENMASHAAFLDADFQTEGAVVDRPARHLRYSCRRNGAGEAG